MQDDPESLDGLYSLLSPFYVPVDACSLQDDDTYDAQSTSIKLLSPPPHLSEGCMDQLDSTNINEFLEGLEPMTSTRAAASSGIVNEATSGILNGAAGCSHDSAHQTEKPLPSSKQNKARVYRTGEIQSLRETVRKLMAELKSLRPQRHFENGSPTSSEQSIWEGIAKRQLEFRRQAEEENTKLRCMLEIQMHEARNLRRVLKRRTNIELMEEMLGVKRQKVIQYTVPTDNPQVFESMLLNMNDLYVSVDAVFSEKGLYDLPCPGRRREARRNVTNGLFLELTQRHAMPFTFQKSEKAIWKALSFIVFQDLKSIGDDAKRMKFHAYYVEEANQTMKISYFVETPTQGALRGVDFRKVVRKYVDNDRVVFIWKCLMKPVLTDKSKATGFCSQSILRIIVREIPDKRGFSTIDSYFIATRNDEGLSVADTIRTPSNLDMGIAAWDETISRIAHQVENLVIDQSKAL